MTLTWREEDGTETDLDDTTSDFYVVAGPVGLDAPPPVNTIENFTEFDGGLLANRRRTVRQVVLPFLVTHATRVQTAVGQLVRLLQGPGELEFDDGTNTRYLRNVIYDGGLGGNLTEFTLTGDKVVVASLLALDPWWYGEEILVSATIGVPTDFDASIDFDADVPFDGGTATTIDVDGDTDAFPVVTVYGPATTLVVDGGELDWELAVELTGGDVLVVDSRPGSRGPRLNGGAVDWSLLTPASRLWTLAEGTNRIAVGVTGATADTQVQIGFSPRWLTP